MSRRLPSPPRSRDPCLHTRLDRRPGRYACWLRAPNTGPSTALGHARWDRRLSAVGRDDEFVHGRTGHSTRSLAAHRQIAVGRRLLGAQLTLVLTGGQSRVTERAALRPRNTDRSQCGTGTRHTESRGRYECSESSSGSRVVAQRAEPARGSMCVCGGRQPRPLASSDRMPTCSDGWGS